MAKQSASKSIRIQDLAEKIGTSTSTVSRALNDHPKISLAMKQKVLDMAIQLGYKPSIPSLMSGNESKTIALILPNITSSYYLDIINAVKQYVEENSYALFICETAYQAQKERFFFEQIELMKMQGLIYLAHKNSDKQEILEIFAKKKFPMVFIHENKLKEKVPTVILDVYQSLSEAVEHLKSNEAKNISLLIDDVQNPINSQIEELFAQLIKSEDNPNTTRVFYINSNDELMHKQLEAVLQNNQTADALIISSMQLAYAVQLLMNKGLIGSKKLLLISLTKDAFDGFARPKISYFNLRGDQIGGAAAKLLFKQIKNGMKAESKAFFSRLIIKSSSMRM